jgi:prephenate dehydratase
MDRRVFTKKFKKMIFFIDIEKDKRYTKNMNEIKNKTTIIVISGVVYTIGLALFWMSQL